ncbi:hypothetical protein L6452_08972 [Arctium lappa]|uniref:Uncharacterized protein n=1 Tax=Arctium lappa TaxID=4217 RepID=A0ACB9DJJ4_ARCLA|nr:hypothetical protein L6452_08972 [Arctium lappa]
MQAAEDAIEAIKKASVVIKGKSTAREPDANPSDKNALEPYSSVLAKRPLTIKTCHEELKKFKFDYSEDPEGGEASSHQNGEYKFRNAQSYVQETNTSEVGTLTQQQKDKK